MKDDPAAIKEKVRDYVHQSVHVNNQKIEDNALIFKEGYLDSMGFIILISFLEDEFDIKTKDSDLIEENFESVNAISDFIIRKSGR